MYGLALLFGAPKRGAMAVATALAQGGEFAFVLLSFTVGAGVIGAQLAALLTAAVAVSMLERLTNHVLPSTIHRVVNPPPERRGVPRYSTPFFLHFASDYEIKTLPNCVTPENPDRYPESITADEFLQQRLREIKLA